MIINIYTIISLFIAGVSLVLGLFLAGVSLYLHKKWKKVSVGEDRTKVEDFAYLVLLLAGVILFVRLVSWPLFYATLDSYIPEVQGAMCVAGVCQIKPGMANLVQAVKPLVFFLVGGWLILNMLDRRSQTGLLMGRKFLFLSLVSILVIGDAVGEALLLFNFNASSSVACCTTIFDVPSRTSALVPRSIFGAQYGDYMIPLYYVSNIMTLAVLGLLLLMGVTGVAYLAAAAGLALINLFVTGISSLEKIAPALMGLPYHHCIYCLPKNVPDGGIIIALFIIGTFATGWALLIRIMGRGVDAAERYATNLIWLAFMALLSSLLMVSVHLFVS